MSKFCFNQIILLVASFAHCIYTNTTYRWCFNCYDHPNIIYQIVLFEFNIPTDKIIRTNPNVVWNPEKKSKTFGNFIRIFPMEEWRFYSEFRIFWQLGIHLKFLPIHLNIPEFFFLDFFRTSFQTINFLGFTFGLDQYYPMHGTTFIILFFFKTIDRIIICLCEM